MGFRLIGMLFLCMTAFFLCRAIRQLEEKRIRQTEGFLLLLRHLRAMISCYRAPVREIYDGVSSPALEECGFLAVLAERGDFGAAIDSCRDRLLLRDEEIRLLSSFGRELGGSYREEEVESCSYYIGELERAYAALREEHPKRVRLSRSLVITGTLMLVILLA